MVEENVFPFNGAASFHNFCVPEKSVGKPFKEIHRICRNASAVAKLRKHIGCNQTKIRLKKTASQSKNNIGDCYNKKDKNIRMRAMRTCHVWKRAKVKQFRRIAKCQHFAMSSCESVPRCFKIKNQKITTLLIVSTMSNVYKNVGISSQEFLNSTTLEERLILKKFYVITFLRKNRLQIRQQN